LHFAVPFALLVPVLGIRRAIAVSLISLTLDLDVFFHVHRSASHSLVLLLAASLVAIGLVRKLKPRSFGLVSVGCLALLGHPVMDMFSTYTPILYPIVKESVYLNVEAKVLIGSLLWPSLAALIKTEPTSFTGFDRFEAPIFTSEGFALTLLLVAIPFIMASLWRVQTPSKRITLERESGLLATFERHPELFRFLNSQYDLPRYSRSE